eukprot:720791-Prymnesium_polylepis.1
MKLLNLTHEPCLRRSREALLPEGIFRRAMPSRAVPRDNFQTGLQTLVTEQANMITERHQPHHYCAHTHHTAADAATSTVGSTVDHRHICARMRTESLDWRRIAACVCASASRWHSTWPPGTGSPSA